MSSSSLTLDDFIQPVPVCPLTTDLETVLDIFNLGLHQAIAVVNAQGELLGTLTGSVLRKWQKISINLSIKPSLQDLTDLIDPLEILPLRMSLAQFLSKLPENPQKLAHFPSYGIVDPQGQFLGLLDSYCLLKFLATLSPDPPPLAPQLPQLLWELLEQLPLAAQLTTEQGEIVYENTRWREQLGDYITPLAADLPWRHSPTVLYPGDYPFLSQEEAASISLPPQGRECLHDHAVLSVKQFPEPTYSPSSPIVPQSLTLDPLRDRNSPHESSSPRPLASSASLNQSSGELLKVLLNFQEIEGNFQPLWLSLRIDTPQIPQLIPELPGQNEAIRGMNHFKKQFLACISHELKSPLTSVIGLSSLLKDQRLGTLNDRQMYYTQLIYQSGRQLMTLVNDLLDFSRIETGQLTLRPTRVNIASVCQQAYQLLEERYQGRLEGKIPVNLDIAAEVESLKADEGRLQQMLFHLLDNALKLTAVEGQMGLRVNCWGQWMAFTVWDTGRGIPEDAQTQLFQSYPLWEDYWTRQVEGMGLGLMLTQRLAKAHGGDISFISRQGRGNQFTLLLPVQETEPLQPGEMRGAKNRGYPWVLVVDSISTAIERISDLLMGLGYRVIIARSGTEALEKARQLQPAYIFLNPLLPLLSGWDVLKLLKSDPYTQQLKVIVTSSPVDQHYSKQIGADGFLSLPVDLPDLKAILEEYEPLLTSPIRYLTLLRLHPDPEQTDSINSVMDAEFDLYLGGKLSQLNYRLLEAHNLEQGEMIACVWDVDVVVLDTQSLKDPLKYFRAFRRCENLSALPLVTLDAEITQAANQVEGLSVFPCLLPSDNHQFEPLLQVISIAAESYSPCSC